MSFVSFLKVYTLPILVLLLGFGLYYLIFVYTNKPNNPSLTHEIQTNILERNSQIDQSHSFQNQETLSTQAPLQKQIQGQELDSKKPILPVNDPYTSSTSNDFQTYIVLPKAVNIRRYPKTTSESIGKLKQNEILEVEFIDKGWAKIKTLKKENAQEQSGWVLAKLLALVQKPQTIPSNLVSTSKHNATGRYLPVSNNVRIRSSPDLASKIVGKLQPNKIVDVQKIQNGWAKIADGWVSLKFLKKQKD